MPTLDEYMQMLQINPEQLKQQKIAALLGGLGQGLLSAPGQRGVANAGLAAFQGVNSVAPQMNADAMAKLQQRSMIQGLADQDMAREDKMKQRAADQSWQQQLPALFQPPSLAQQLGSGAPTVENAQRAEGVKPPQKWQVYESIAQKALQAGRQQDAKMYMDLADKFRPKVKNENTGTDAQGNRVRYVTYEDGTTQVLPVGPDKEKAHFADTGGAVMPLDPFTGRPIGQGVGKTMSPDAQASNAVAWANYGLSKDRLGFDREKDARDAANPKQDKPSDQQLATQSFLARMQNASKTIAPLEAKGYSPGIPGAIAEGAGKLPLVGPLIGGAAALTGNAIYPEAPKYRQAASEWIRAKLRKESGAVIGKEEEEGEFRTYFPQPTDTPEVIKQKAAARAAVEASMAQQASGQRNAQPPAMPAVPPPIGSIVSGYRFKGGDPNKKENWERM